MDPTFKVALIKDEAYELQKREKKFLTTNYTTFIYIVLLLAVWMSTY